MEGSPATDVAALLGLLGEQLRSLLDRRIQVQVEIDPGCPGCNAERGELLLMLLELVTNARDAMPEGGTLRLRARAEPGAVEISVADTGIGMDVLVCHQATRPGFTTKENPRNGGNGLDKVVQFARRCGGELSVHSVPRQGTVVKLLLPAA
jgi:signal transduction histidine kinase